jgi:hypothetical protein
MFWMLYFIMTEAVYAQAKAIVTMGPDRSAIRVSDRMGEYRVVL